MKTYEGLAPIFSISLPILLFEHFIPCLVLSAFYVIKKIKERNVIARSEATWQSRGDMIVLRILDCLIPPRFLTVAAIAIKETGWDMDDG